MNEIINTKYQKIRRDKDELIEHMSTFNLKIRPSVGIWYFTPGGGRFHDSFVSPKDIPEKIEMAAGMAKYGVEAIEAHYPSEVNEENYHLYQRLEKETGIKLISCYPAIFFLKNMNLVHCQIPIKNIGIKQ